MPGGRPKKPPAEKASGFSFRLPPDVAAPLRARADRQGVTLSDVATCALREFFENHPEPLAD